MKESPKKTIVVKDVMELINLDDRVSLSEHGIDKLGFYEVINIKIFVDDGIFIFPRLISFTIRPYDTYLLNQIVKSLHGKKDKEAMIQLMEIKA